MHFFFLKIHYKILYTNSQTQGLIFKIFIVQIKKKKLLSEAVCEILSGKSTITVQLLRTQTPNLCQYMCLKYIVKISKNIKGVN